MNQCIPSFSLTAFGQNMDMYNETGMLNGFWQTGQGTTKILSEPLAFWILNYSDTYLQRNSTK